MDFFKHVENAVIGAACATAEMAQEVAERGGEAIHGAACAAAELAASQGMSDVTEGASAFIDTVKNGVEGAAAATAEGFDHLGEITPSIASGIVAMGEQFGHAAVGTAAATAEGFIQIADNVAKLFPVVAIMLQAYGVIDGTLKAGVVSCGLVAGGYCYFRRVVWRRSRPV